MQKRIVTIFVAAMFALGSGLAPRSRAVAVADARRHGVAAGAVVAAAWHGGGGSWNGGGGGGGTGGGGWRGGAGIGGWHGGGGSWNTAVGTAALDGGWRGGCWNCGWYGATRGLGYRSAYPARGGGRASRQFGAGGDGGWGPQVVSTPTLRGSGSGRIHPARPSRRRRVFLRASCAQRSGKRSFGITASIRRAISHRCSNATRNG